MAFERTKKAMKRVELFSGKIKTIYGHITHKHHRKSQKSGGGNDPENLVELSRPKHIAIHALFGDDVTGPKVVKIMNEIIDPEHVLYCKLRENSQLLLDLGVVKKKRVLILHPIGKNSIEDDIAKMKDIYAKIFFAEKDIIPVIPYLDRILFLRDKMTEEVWERGMEETLESIYRGSFDEVWLYGDGIHRGMERVIRLVLKLGIMVVAKTEGTERDLLKLGK